MDGQLVTGKGNRFPIFCLDNCHLQASAESKRWRFRHDRQSGQSILRNVLCASPLSITGHADGPTDPQAAVSDWIQYAIVATGTRTGKKVCCPGRVCFAWASIAVQQRASVKRESRERIPDL